MKTGRRRPPQERPRGPGGGAPDEAGSAAFTRHDAALRSKYAELCRKHGELVERNLARMGERSAAFDLAISALRHSTTAVALLGTESVRVRDEQWLRLMRTNPGEWREASPDGSQGAQHASLDALAVAIAARLDRPEVVVHAVAGASGRVFTLRVVRRSERRARSAIAFVDDVTDEARRESELESLRRTVAAQERVRELGLLAAGVAHDLSNVIQGVQLRVELLRHEAPALADAAQLEALARLAADAGKRLARLRELASGGAASPPGHVALRDAVLEATELARPHVERASAERRRPVLMQVSVPDLLPPVVADPAELRHVLLNLVLNARDAMPDGGLIRVRAMHAGGWGIVTVTDEGTGFAPEHLHRAFEPFFTTKGERGSGLGLSGAAAFMRRVGGYVAVENRPDGGARVRLTFPAHRAPAEAVEPSASAGGARRDC